MLLTLFRRYALFSLVTLVACAGLPPKSPADQYFEDGSYTVAVAAYEAEEAESPADPTVKRKLGLALLRSGNASAASEKLSEAYWLGGNIRSTLFFLAQAQEANGDVDAALRSYERYVEEGGDPKSVRRKMADLGRVRMRTIMQAALAAEDSLSRVVPPQNALAVLAFANVGKSEKLAALSVGLAAVMITDLRKVDELRILERRQIGLLVAELSRQTVPTTSTPREATPTSPASESTPANKQRAGRILSARRLVQGAFQPLGTTRIQLSNHLVDVLTGAELVTGDSIDGPLEEVLYLEKALVYQVLDALGIEPTQIEREGIDKLATTNFDAFLAYCRGLYYSDLGRFDEAHTAFLEATAKDPNFSEAEQAAEFLDGSDDDFLQANQDEWGIDEEPTGPGDDSFLEDVVGNVGIGPEPDPGIEETDGSDITDSGGQGDDVTITDGEKPARLPSFPLPPGGAGR